MKPVEFIIKDGDEHLPSHSGLALIGAMVNRTELVERIVSMTLPGRQEPKIPHGDIVKSMVGLFCIGKPDIVCLVDRGTTGHTAISYTMPCRA